MALIDDVKRLCDGQRPAFDHHISVFIGGLPRVLVNRNQEDWQLVITA